MSDSHRGDADAPGTPVETGDGDALELFAIEEHFAGAVRAGMEPRLSDYVRRYPQYAEQLTDFVSVFLPEARRDSVVDGATPEEPAGAGLSPGTRRAIDALFSGLNAATRQDDALLVAEERATYALDPVGLAALARVHGLTLAALAEMAHLSAEEVAGLAQVAEIAPDTLPALLVRRIAEALGISESETIRAITGE